MNPTFPIVLGSARESEKRDSILIEESYIQNENVIWYI